MNDTVDHDPATMPPPPPPPPPARRLTRGPGGMFGGVCEGLGRFFDLDPVIFRIGFVVAMLVGGSGLLAYLLMWVLIPRVGEGRPLIGAQQSDEGSRPFVRTAAIVIVVFGVLSLFSFFSGSIMASRAMFRGPWPLLLIIGGAALLWWGQREDRAPLLPPSSSAVKDPPAESSGEGASDDLGALPPPVRPLISDQTVAAVSDRVRGGVETAGAAVRTTVGNYQERPRRPRSVLGRLTVGVILVALAVLAALDNLGVLAPSPRDYLALALTITGLGLVVGASHGRSRPLILLGLVLVPLTLAATVYPQNMAPSAGNRYIALSERILEPRYDLGFGDMQVDLTGGDLSAIPTPLSLRVGAGQLLIYVPANADVRIDWRVGLGEAEILGQTFQGTRLDGSVRDDGSDDGSGDGVRRPTIVLDLEVGAGTIRVFRLTEENA